MCRVAPGDGKISVVVFTGAPEIYGMMSLLLNGDLAAKSGWGGEDNFDMGAAAEDME